MGFGCRYPVHCISNIFQKKNAFSEWHSSSLCPISPQLHLGLLATVVANATHPQSKTIERNVPGPKNVHRVVCTPWDCRTGSMFTSFLPAQTLVMRMNTEEMIFGPEPSFINIAIPKKLLWGWIDMSVGLFLHTSNFFSKNLLAPQSKWLLSHEVWSDFRKCDGNWFLIPDAPLLWVVTTYLKSENLLSKIRESIICPFSQIIGELFGLQTCASNTFIVINQNLQTNLCFVEWKYVNDPFSRLRPQHSVSLFICNQLGHNPHRPYPIPFRPKHFAAPVLRPMWPWLTGQ